MHGCFNNETAITESYSLDNNFIIGLRRVYLFWQRIRIRGTSMLFKIRIKTDWKQSRVDSMLGLRDMERDRDGQTGGEDSVQYPSSESE